MTEQIRGDLPSGCAPAGDTALQLRLMLRRLSPLLRPISRRMATTSRSPSLTHLEVWLLQNVQVNPENLRAGPYALTQAHHLDT